MEEPQNQFFEMLNTFFNGVDELVYILDTENYELLFANDRFKQAFGENVVGQKCYKIMQNADQPCASCPRKDVYGENLGKICTRESRNKMNSRWYKCVGKAIQLPNGRTVLFGMDVDITEHKQIQEALQKSESQYRNLVETAQEVIYTLSSDGIITSLNPAFEKLTGWSRAEWLGRPFTPLIHSEDRSIAIQSFQDTLHGKQTYPIELRILSNSGKYLVGEFTSAPLIEDGKIVGEFGIARNITERKQIIQSLQKSEELFRLVVENSHDGIIIIDDKYKIIYANDECTHMFGHSHEEVVGKDFRTLLGKEARDLAEDRYLRRQRGETVPTCYEIKVTGKDGKERIVEGKIIVARDSQDNMRTIAQVLDVTDHKKMDDERKRFEGRLSMLNKYGQSLNMAENLSEMYKVVLEAMDRTLGFEYASILALEGKMLKLKANKGYPKQLSVNLTLEEEKGVTVRAAKTGSSILIPDIRKEKSYILGKPGMLSELAVPIKLGNTVLGVLNVESEKLAAFDEKDRESLEILASHTAVALSNLKSCEKLGKMSERIENLMKNSARIMHMRDMHQRLKVIASAIEDFGWRRVVISLRNENLESVDVVTAGLTEEEIKVLMDRKASSQIWHERLGPKFERFKIGEFYYLPWSDPWVRENVHGLPPDLQIEEPTTYAGVPSCVPEREMVDWHPQDMLYAPLRTPEGKIIGILSMDDPLDGRKPSQRTLTPLGIFLHQAAMVIENAQLIESLNEARKQLQTYTGQLERKVEERTRELEESQDQLLKAQRLAVIGELAGMVGHDLRNPLTSINGAAYYVKKRLGPEADSKVVEMLELIEKNIVYSNKIINDLLDYSKEMRLDFAESTPKSIIDETLTLVTAPENVHLTNLVEDKPKIKADTEKLQRAFINLVKNAFEAMPEGGTLTIKSRKLNGNVEFTFSDTGVGMPKETIRKLWTPLFTTKAKGMGFGLPICKRIIEAHGGFISVESVVGKGTTFVVTIPVEQKTSGGENVWVKTLESSLSTMTKISEKYW
jgi:PAS domain S-box-containing protein